MTEFEKITTALSRCQRIASNCIDCPYNEHFGTSHDCEIKLHNDAHTMLTQMLKDMHEMHDEKGWCIVCKHGTEQTKCEENNYYCPDCKADWYCKVCRNGNKFEWRGA